MTSPGLRLPSPRGRGVVLDSPDSVLPATAVSRPPSVGWRRHPAERFPAGRRRPPRAGACSGRASPRRSGTRRTRDRASEPTPLEGGRPATRAGAIAQWLRGAETAPPPARSPRAPAPAPPAPPAGPTRRCQTHPQHPRPARVRKDPQTPGSDEESGFSVTASRNAARMEETRASSTSPRNLRSDGDSPSVSSEPFQRRSRHGPRTSARPRPRLPGRRRKLARSARSYE